MSSRDFDHCAYVSKSGKTSCGALRYYHDDFKKPHSFVEGEDSLRRQRLLELPADLDDVGGCQIVGDTIQFTHKGHKYEIREVS